MGTLLKYRDSEKILSFAEVTSSADADKPARRIYRSVKVTKRMLGIVSYCAIVTLSLRRADFLIFDFKKCCALEIRVRGHSRSLIVIDRLRMVSY